MLKDNERIGGRKLYPEAYSLQGFTTNFCQGCSYLTSSEIEDDKRFRTCRECIPSIDCFYRNRQPILVVQDEKGKNIATPIE